MPWLKQLIQELLPLTTWTMLVKLY
jgi:hypothetical protein